MSDGAGAGPAEYAPVSGAAHWSRALSEQKWFVIVFVLSALATSLALTYVYSEKFESTTAISYRVQEVTRFKAQQNEALGSPAPQPPFKVIGATLQEVLKSDAVLRDVVQTLRLHEKETKVHSDIWYVAWYQAAKDWLREYAGYAWKLLKYGRIIDDDPMTSAINELRGNIKVTNRDSYIFNLAVRDKSPERAARIVEHLSAVLSNWLLEFDRQPGRTRADQLRSLLDSKAEELATRRKEIEDLLTLNTIASVQQDGEKVTEQLFALQLEVSRLTSEIARTRNRLSLVQAKLLVKQRILGNLGRPDAAASEPAPAEPVENIPPEDFKKLASERVFVDLDLKSLVAKRDALQSTIDRLTKRLRKTPGVQNRFDTLKLKLGSIEREYEMLNDAYQEAALRATSPVSEVRVLHPALLPTAPVTPIKVYHVLLALGLGLPLSIGLVYLLDYLGLALFLAPVRGPIRRGLSGTVALPVAPTLPAKSDSAKPDPAKADDA